MGRPAINIMIADSTSAEIRSFAYSVNYLSANVGMALGPLLGSFAMKISFNIMFVGDLSSLVFCLLIIAFNTKYLKQNKTKISVKENINLDISLKDKKFFDPFLIFFIFSSFFVISPLFGLEYLMPLVIQNVLCVEVSFAGLIYTINSVLIIIISLFVPKLLKKLTPSLCMVLASTFWMIGMFLMAIFPSLLVFFLTIPFWTLGEIIYSIVLPTYVSKNSISRVKGRYMAFNEVILSLGRFIMPLFLGMFWNIQKTNYLFFALGFLSCIGMLLYLSFSFLCKKEKYLHI